MGKITGFLEYERETSKEVSPRERIKNWKEFHLPLSETEQRKQGAAVWTAAFPSASQA